eukprot:6461486-Amphidinium_carterae.1
MSSIWSRCEYGGAGHTVQLEDLLRHGGTSTSQHGEVAKRIVDKGHQSALEQYRRMVLVDTDAAEQCEFRKDVPSILQFSLAYRVLKRLDVKRTYEQFCAAVRDAGAEKKVLTGVVGKIQTWRAS